MEDATSGREPCPYALLRVSNRAMPRLVVRERERHHAALRGVVFGGTPIADAFEARFFVTCEDERFAREALTPAAMSAMLDRKRVDWLELQGDSVCTYYEPRSLWQIHRNETRIDALVEVIDLAEAIVGALPEHLTKG